MLLNNIRELHQTISKSIRGKLLKYYTDRFSKEWDNTYNSVRGADWPDCNNFNDFKKLPASIQSECINDYEFSPDIWKQHALDNTDLCTVSFEGIEKLFNDPVYKAVLKRNKDIIIDNDIVDFACNSGRYSFLANEMGAASVIGFDSRDENLLLANAIKESLNINDNEIIFTKIDIHNYDAVTEVCSGKQTAIVAGIMYHLHDHYQVLDAISCADIKNIMIETVESSEIYNIDKPLIWWAPEQTIQLFNGEFNNKSDIFVGRPNKEWFIQAAAMLDYKHVSSEVNSHPADNHIHSTHIFQHK